MTSASVSKPPREAVISVTQMGFVAIRQIMQGLVILRPSLSGRLNPRRTFRRRPLS